MLDRILRDDEMKLLQLGICLRPGRIGLDEMELGRTIRVGSMVMVGDSGGERSEGSESDEEVKPGAVPVDETELRMDKETEEDMSDEPVGRT